ncbi:MAG: hypothetical protein ABFC80_08910 [Coriobacteriales bacterium]|nr:hypothetical protein [Actinomycetes bacterium]
MKKRSQPRISRRSATRKAPLAILAVVAGALVLLTFGCAGNGGSPEAGSAETSPAVVPHGGAAVEVHVTPEALADKPEPWSLSTPEEAVRSYLDWVSYAYRIGQSDVATPTMTPYQQVRVDSYVQYNIQKGRLIDQQLTDLTFGKPSVGTTSTLLPVRESWTYRYVSVETAGKTLEGPYSVSYESTYTVVKRSQGWLVDRVEAKALGEVK